MRDSHYRKMGAAVAEEFSTLFDKYMNMMRKAPTDMEEILFSNYVKSHGSETLIKVVL